MQQRPGRRALAHVTCASRPLWRLRIERELPRYIVCAAGVAGLLASARYAIVPPVSARSAGVARAAEPDPAAAGVALLFVRRYLSWDSAEPEASAGALAPFAGTAMEAQAGVQPPPNGRQRVEWAQVVQERRPRAGEWVYTVAAETDAQGLVYLSVSVVRTAAGALALADYPAFVGAPLLAPAQLAEHPRLVADTQLAAVVTRALRNYMSASEGDLAADLAPGARVSLPSVPLQMDALERLSWQPEGGSVTALVQAHDARGARYLLAYELDVARDQGRWEISAIQTDPTS